MLHDVAQLGVGLVLHGGQRRFELLDRGGDLRERVAARRARGLVEGGDLHLVVAAGEVEAEGAGGALQRLFEAALFGGDAAADLGAGLLVALTFGDGADAVDDLGVHLVHRVDERLPVAGGEGEHGGLARAARVRAASSTSSGVGRPAAMRLATERAQKVRPVPDAPTTTT